jgi:predicted site-specific integrase-resolvase
MGQAGCRTTVGGHCCYGLTKLKAELCRAEDDAQRRALAYARQSWTFEVIVNLGSGMNYHKKGLKRLLDALVEGRIGRVVITRKDRLLRIGKDVLEILTVCMGRTRARTGSYWTV